MVAMRLRAVGLALSSSLLLGVAGCEHLPSFLAWIKPAPRMVKITPIPANLAPVAPNAAEDRLYAHAVKSVGARDYGAALDVLKMAQEARPADARVLNAMGVIYDKLGRFDLSARYYDLAERADPGSMVVAINRRYSLLLQQRGLGTGSGAALMLAESGGSPGPAVAIAGLRPVAPPARPSAADGLYAQAVEQIQQRDYTRALALLEWASSAKRDDPRILTAMGVVYDKLGRFDLSGHFYDLAEQADPGSRVVALDRRYSRLLQQHGGAGGTADTIEFAGAPRTGDRHSLGHAG